MKSWLRRRVEQRLGAENYFRRLFPLLSGIWVTKLAILAVSNWENPERFK